MGSNSKKIAVAYVPVLHAGYRQFFKVAVEEGVTAVYLVGDDILEAHQELDYINRKDRLRAIPVEQMQKVLEVLIDLPVLILTKEKASSLKGVTIVAPQEDITNLLEREYFKGASVRRVPIFLRWHRDNTVEDAAVAVHGSGNVSDLDRAFMAEAFHEAQKSLDWWRQVGAVIAKGGEMLFVAHNEHMPDPQSPYTFGDPRTIYKKGVNIQLTTAAHGEGALIALAAREGTSLKGASIYVTDFPCPFCARMIAHSGIAKCYFSKGYAALDGEHILKDAGIELIHIDMKKERE